jgi:hypothetical protein
VERKEFIRTGNGIITELYQEAEKIHNLMSAVQAPEDGGSLVSEWWTLNAASKALGAAIDTLTGLTGFGQLAGKRPSAFPDTDD